MNPFKFRVGQVIKGRFNGRLDEIKVLFRWQHPYLNSYDVQFLSNERNATFDEDTLQAIHLKCKQTEKLPVVSEWQEVREPDCKYHNQGHCENPDRLSEDDPCPLEKVLPLPSRLAQPDVLAEYENALGTLAMRYRQTKDVAVRQKVIEQYSAVVDLLIRSGHWVESPPPEDQLPYEDMPEAFYKYWENEIWEEEES